MKALMLFCLTLVFAGPALAEEQFARLTCVLSNGEKVSKFVLYDPQNLKLSESLGRFAINAHETMNPYALSGRCVIKKQVVQGRIFYLCESGMLEEIRLNLCEEKPAAPAR